MSDWKNVQYKGGKYRTSDEGGGGSSTFAGLNDVSFNNIQNGQVPKYNSTTQKWENADESGSGGTVTDVEVDGQSVVNAQGVAEIEMPNVPVQDVQVDGTSVVNQQGVAEITIPTPPAPDYPVTDVKVNGTSVVSNKQALITSYKEVTLAEYQALPSSKLSDDVMYCIKDVGGANQFPPLIYSKEEREIGVWTDGRPLYQKTVYWTGSLNNGQNITIDSNINLSNVGIFVSDIAFLKFSGYSYVTSSINGKVLDVELVNQGVMIENFTGYTIIEILLTYRYTKTTDIPGSGTWTTQGGYAHHYSTDEKVIGTWIDGKPLYEKTFDYTLTERTYSGTQVLINMPNINPISIEGRWINLANGIGFMNHSIQYYYSLGYENSNIVLYSNDWLDVGYKITIIIQYTKTTD